MRSFRIAVALILTALPASAAEPAKAVASGTLTYDGAVFKIVDVYCRDLGWPAMRLVFMDTPMPAAAGKDEDSLYAFLEDKVTRIDLGFTFQTLQDKKASFVMSKIVAPKNKTNPGAGSFDAESAPYVFEVTKLDDKGLAGRFYTTAPGKTQSWNTPHTFDLKFEIPRAGCGKL